MGELDRRTFLLGAAGVAGAGSLLAACGDEGGGTVVVTTTTLEPLATPLLVPTGPDGFVGPSPFVHSVEQRIAYALSDGNDIMRRTAPDRVQLEIIDATGAVVGGGTSNRRDVGVPTPYYSVLFTPPQAGRYRAVLTNAEGSTERDISVLNPGETAIPQPGDILPAVATATLDDPRGVTPLCTRLEPCPFHGTNLVDALGAGDRPTILSIATPGFCRTAVCGPVIDLLIEATASRDDLYVIHAEVFVDPQSQTESIAQGLGGDLTEVVSAYELPFEPVLFVADADGVVRRRLDATYDGSELAEALALV
jgi:hypothetical protein